MEREIVCFRSPITSERVFNEDIIDTVEYEITLIFDLDLLSTITTELVLFSDTQVVKGENCGS
jgi:hypothetical protein